MNIRKILTYIICAAVLIFLYLINDPYGVRPSMVEEDARLSHKIEASWLLEKNESDELIAMLFYKADLKDHSFSIYTSKHSKLNNFRFIHGGSLSSIDRDYEIIENPESNDILFSMNQQAVSKIIVTVDKSNLEYDFDPIKPIVLILPKDYRSLQLINSSGKSIHDSSFNFSIRYGVDGKNSYSSFDHTLTLDTVEGIKSIELILSQKDMKEIEEKILALSIMTEDFSNLPYDNKYWFHIGINELYIERGDQIQGAYWTTNNAPPVDFSDLNNIKKKKDPLYDRVEKLFELRNFIIDILPTYEEYHELPAPSMYL